jgi:type I restriction enzyme S subunit
MNAQQLKNAILQEAIEGRLVPQDPNDEPASALLERIRKEKEKLLKEGKLKKKDLIETPISEDEKPFEIPESWEWVRLGNITEIARGGSPRPIKEYLTDDPKGLNWIKIGDTDKGGKYINSCKEKIKPEGLKKTRKVHPGDFLLTNSMSFGRPYITNIEGCIHDGWLMISPYAGVFDQSYLYYVLSSAYAHKQFCDKVAGAVVQNLNSDKVADSIVPLPPLAEQQRIVAKIEELLPKVEEYGKAQDALNKLNAELPERLKKSILQEAIEGRLVPQDPNDEPASVLLEKIRKEKARLVKEGKLKKKDLEEKPISEDEKPFEIPESWEWVRIGTIFNHSSGKQLSGSNTEGALREYITTSNLYWGRFELDNLKSMYYKDSELEKCTAKQGDLLVCEGGDIGRSAIWPYDYDICLQNHVHRLRPYDNRYTKLVFYIMWYYKSVGLIGGKGIGIQGLSASALKQIAIPLPPLAEQKRIVAKIEEVFKEIDKLKK